ncbi:PTS sugar transporter subunit IIA [Erysipelothrix sp. HDW6C]|uniref:PTS sugar transporter subunit IIA n=1 Tax=Erysipelothrix sp. HDW6C TaxID=2714930 RepID=UPI00140BC425|nr:PTS sugar transporter subunit IIA [Erysipelothrix sp. HDW6C]QIK69843.1 PTS sugar transporter subunit IIA [Erysipelothrix sp. HDW6C]
MQIIITGHGHFASGMMSALALIAGENAQICAIDFDGADDGSRLATALKKQSNMTPTLILTDLYGGTPFRQAALMAMQDSNIRVVAGANLGMVLELAMKIAHAKTLDSMLDNLVEVGRENIVIFNHQ